MRVKPHHLTVMQGSDAKTKPMSTVHSMGDFGMLQCGMMNPDSLNFLRERCNNSPPDTVHSALGMFDEPTMALLHQSHKDCQHLLCVKALNGYAIVTSGKVHKLVSLIKDSKMCEPSSVPNNPKIKKSFPISDPYYGSTPADDDDETDENLPQPWQRQTWQTPNNNSLVPVMRGTRVTVTKMNGQGAGEQHQSHFFSIVQHPQMPPVQNITFVHHDGLVRHDEVSRFSPIEGMLSQLVGNIPLSPEPRKLMEAPCMGNLSGRCLVGPEADLVKRVFFEGVKQASCGPNGPSGIYNTPINISDVIAKLLSMRLPVKPICVGRLKDGIVGYRPRTDGRNSLVFMGTSNDFNSTRCAPVNKSTLHLIKATYTNRSQAAPRIFVHFPNQLCDSPHVSNLGTPPVMMGSASSADVRSIMEHSFRVHSRADLGCAEYPAVCMKAAVKHLRDTNQDIFTVHGDACRRMLDAMQATHGDPNSFGGGDVFQFPGFVSPACA